MIFQLTQAETIRRDELYGEMRTLDERIEALRALDEQIKDADGDIQTAIDERNRIAILYNDTAAAAKALIYAYLRAHGIGSPEAIDHLHGPKSAA